MSLPTHQQVDTWHATVWNLLDTTTGSLYDLIDLGPAAATVTARTPSRAEQSATDRADGNFHPTTKSQGHRRTGHSDPVGRQVEAWEAEAQQAVTALYALVAAADDLAHTLALNAPPRPPEPPVRATLSGTTVVDLGPVGCRRAVMPAIGFCGEVYDRLADRLRGTSDPEAGDRLLEQADIVRRDLVALVRRLGGDRPRLCACGCRRPAPPKGQGATRPACRKQAERERRAS